MLASVPAEPRAQPMIDDDDRAARELRVAAVLASNGIKISRRAVLTKFHKDAPDRELKPRESDEDRRRSRVRDASIAWAESERARLEILAARCEQQLGEVTDPLAERLLTKVREALELHLTADEDRRWVELRREFLKGDSYLI